MTYVSLINGEIRVQLKVCDNCKIYPNIIKINKKNGSVYNIECPHCGKAVNNCSSLNAAESFWNGENNV